MLNNIKRYGTVVVLMIFWITFSDTTLPGAAPYDEGELTTELGISSTYLSGHTTYHISYYEGPTGIESKLEFPLRTYLMGIEGAISYTWGRKDNKFRLGFIFLKNIDNGSGKLKNSDWLSDDIDIYLYGRANPGKDIYSESDIDLDAFISDINMGYSLYASSRLSFSPLIGYRHQPTPECPQAGCPAYVPDRIYSEQWSFSIIFYYLVR